MSTATYDFAIAGGGPAGCAAAMRAARAGVRVLLLERGRYPRQKVCGEFLSASGATLLQGLDSGLARHLVESAPRIARARLFLDGKTIAMQIEPPAASVTRHALDFAMWQACREAGVDCRQQTAVESISGGGPFEIRTSAGTFRTRAMLVAAGRWSNLRGDRPDGSERWIGLKAHFRENSPPASVDLYFFEAGYCGVQAVGPDTVNACAMVRADAARTLQEAFHLHPELERRSNGWQPASEAVSTSPLVFSAPQPVDGCILHAGDAAGFIDPFLGDGMSLALCSGVLAADCLVNFWSGGITLAQATRNYGGCYRRELLPLFRNASVLRRSLSLPAGLRRPLVSLLNAGPIARWVLERTRPAVNHRDP
jgi:flavin-dependent dehydrogenase